MMTSTGHEKDLYLILWQNASKSKHILCMNIFKDAENDSQRLLGTRITSFVVKVNEY